MLFMVINIETALTYMEKAFNSQIQYLSIMRHVHICSLGWDHEPILEPIMGGGLVCDKLYLLWNDNERINKTLDRVRDVVSKANGKMMIETKEIDPFDYYSVIKAVKEISIEEKRDNSKDVKLYINITVGTGIIVGALCASSYFTDAQIYYNVDAKMALVGTPPSELIKKIHTPKIPDTERMDEKQKIIISYLAEQKKRVLKRSIMELFRPYKGSDKALGSLITHHLKILEKNELIEGYDSEADRREKEYVTTDLGTMLALWLPKRDGLR